MNVVAILAGRTVAGEMIVVAALALLLGAGEETFLGAWVRTRQRRVESFVVDVEDDVATWCNFFRRDVDILGSARFADCSPRIGVC